MCYRTVLSSLQTSWVRYLNVPKYIHTSYLRYSVLHGSTAPYTYNAQLYFPTMSVVVHDSFKRKA